MRWRALVAVLVHRLGHGVERMHKCEALPRTNFLVVDGDVRFGKEADKAVLDSEPVGSAASVVGAGGSSSRAQRPRRLGVPPRSHRFGVTTPSLAPGRNIQRSPALYCNR